MPNTWLGHSLDLDIMAQGISSEQAVAALMEVLSETIAFRLTQGLPPIKWSPAPDEVWKGAESSIGQALDRNPPVSPHNGDRTVISDVYLRGICRAFGIDFETFKSKL
ncbi:MAG TPA: hypothetical protein VFG23_08130 [Polyangia bacterium]|nr:hypothetical protein [Polyangia bacterium]